MKLKLGTISKPSTVPQQCKSLHKMNLFFRTPYMLHSHLLASSMVSFTATCMMTPGRKTCQVSYYTGSLHPTDPQIMSSCQDPHEGFAKRFMQEKFICYWMAPSNDLKKGCNIIKVIYSIPFSNKQILQIAIKNVYVRKALLKWVTFCQGSIS